MEDVKIFSQPQLIAYKRDTNIRDMLVQSKATANSYPYTRNHSVQLG